MKRWYLYLGALLALIGLLIVIFPAFWIKVVVILLGLAMIAYGIYSLKVTKALFDDLSDLDYIFLQLQLTYHVSLTTRKSAIIFDEVQLCPKARQAIKAFVEDGRYDYIETGSLISIHKNVKDILIPSEERKIQMFPMDF